jgi:hypothetical protein
MKAKWTEKSVDYPVTTFGQKWLTPLSSGHRPATSRWYRGIPHISKFLGNFDCDECRAILRALQDAHELDQEDLRKQRYTDCPASASRSVGFKGTGCIAVFAHPDDGGDER